MALFTITPANLNAINGGMAHDIDKLFLRIEEQKAWMDSITDATFVAAGYVQADVNTMRSAMSDLDALRQIYQGLTIATPAGAAPYDFRTFAKQTYQYGSIT